MNTRGKQSTALTILGISLVIGTSAFAASLSERETNRLDAASTMIVNVMEKAGITVQEFVDLLEPFKVQFADEEQKLARVTYVHQAVVDTYFGVDDFDGCTLYYDGCNECAKDKNSYEMACTERACIHQDTPKCLSYDELSEDKDVDGELCENEGGTRLVEYQECEGISQTVCEDNGGVFNECGSACRHDPATEMCTLQCVAYCDFSSDVVITDHTETQEDLEAAVALREENGSDNYEAVQQMSCFCLTDFTRPISFDVTNGKVVLSSARYSDSEGGKLPEMAPELHTVEDMFALISDAIKNNAETITVEYDDELGYPTSVRIDQAAIMADEEISYSYSVELK